MPSQSELKHIRQANLVITLMASERVWSATRLRETIEAYADRTDAAFARMFERDKQELREIGVPIETVTVPGTLDEEGYRIRAWEYRLEQVTFDAEELAALSLAGSLLQTPEFASRAQTAVMKLRAAGIEVRDPGLSLDSEFVAFSGNDEANLAILTRTATAGGRLRFTHRSGPTAAPIERTVDVWGLATARGRWYLVGYDLLRDAPRTFRVDRIVGTPVPVAVRKSEPAHPLPEDLSISDHVRRISARQDPVSNATVWVAANRGGRLRRTAVEVVPHEATQKGPGEESGPGPRQLPLGGSIVTVPLYSVNELAHEIRVLGTDAVAIDPPELVARVTAGLAALTVPPAATPDTETGTSNGKQPHE